MKVTKKAVDKSQPDTALLYLKFKASLKPNQDLADLELTFKGMRDGESLVIASNELQAIKGKTGRKIRICYINIELFFLLDELAKPAIPFSTEHVETSSRKEISMDLLSEY